MDLQVTYLVIIVMGLLVFVVVAIATGRRTLLRTLAFIGVAILAVTAGWAIFEPPVGFSGWVKTIVASVLGVVALGGGLSEIYGALSRSDKSARIDTAPSTVVRQRARGRSNRQVGVIGHINRGIEVNQNAAGRNHYQVGAAREACAAPLVEAASTVPDAPKLWQLLVDRLSDSELCDLVTDLEVDYEVLPHDTKADLARELLRYLEMRDRPLSDVIDWLKSHRPDVRS